MHLVFYAVNSGNVQLRQVNLTVPGVEGLACNDTPATGLTILVDQPLTCEGTIVFDQDALERGSRDYVVVGTAANLEHSISSDLVPVRVAAMPQLQLDVDGLNCTKPDKLRKHLTCSVCVY